MYNVGILKKEKCASVLEVVFRVKLLLEPPTLVQNSIKDSKFYIKFCMDQVCMAYDPFLITSHSNNIGYFLSNQLEMSSN